VSLHAFLALAAGFATIAGLLTAAAGVLKVSVLP